MGGPGFVELGQTPDWVYSFSPVFIHGRLLLPAAGTCICFFLVSSLALPSAQGATGWADLGGGTQVGSGG